MRIPTCPNEESLLAILLDDDASGDDRAHVSGCTDCRERMTRLGLELSTVRGMGAAWVGGAVAPPPPILPANIGRYLVVGALGAGSQGRVYRSVHPRLGVEVAIKWSDIELGTDPDRRDALVAEGQVLARLNHPHLIRVLDLDVHEGRPFLVMEYVRGGDLEERVKAGRVAPEQAARWLAQLARALEEAHANGITHQDIKPRNVLVDDAQQVRLGDFGLARLRQAGPVGEEPLGGTLPYMAPEQARKEVEKIGPASDVFGLGGVLYFLLTGKAPFEGDNPLLVRQRACEGAVDFAALEAARVPRPLAAICRRALAADPAQRYPSARAMAADLERWLNRSRFKPFLLAGVAIFVAVVAGFFLFWPRSSPLPENRQPLPEGPQPLIEQVTKAKDGTLGSLYRVPRLGVGDRCKIFCDVPRGSTVALFAVDSQGKVKQVKDFRIIPGKRFDRLVYPPGEGTIRQSGPPGTELLLVCAWRSAPRTEVIESLLAQKDPWPIIKGKAFLSLCPDKLRSPDEIPDAGVRRDWERDGSSTDFSRAWDRLEQLRQQLLKHCDFFVGVVYGCDK